MKPMGSEYAIDLNEESDTEGTNVDRIQRGRARRSTDPVRVEDGYRKPVLIIAREGGDCCGCCGGRICCTPTSNTKRNVVLACACLGICVGVACLVLLLVLQARLNSGGVP